MPDDEDLIATHEGAHVTMATCLGLRVRIVQIGDDPHFDLVEKLGPDRRLDHARVLAARKRRAEMWSYDFVFDHCQRSTAQVPDHDRRVHQRRLGNRRRRPHPLRGVLEMPSRLVRDRDVPGVLRSDNGPGCPKRCCAGSSHKVSARH
jgi:hypothetical protein